MLLSDANEKVLQLGKNHLYANFTKDEVENVVDEIQSEIASTKHRKSEINNSSDWEKCF